MRRRAATTMLHGLGPRHGALLRGRGRSANQTPLLLLRGQGVGRAVRGLPRAGLARAPGAMRREARLVPEPYDQRDQAY